MPRPRIQPFWVERIRTFLANDPAMTGTEIRHRLASDPKIKKEAPLTPVPSDRAIRRVMAEFRAAPKGERLPYQFFAWPGSMENGALPWEASRAVLDLLRFRTENGLGPPLIREAQWFWRVTLAIPDAPIGKRRHIALHLAMHAIALNPSPQTLTAVQWKLTYQPWRSAKDKKAYGQLPSELRKSPVMELPIPAALPLLALPVRRTAQEQSRTKTKRKKGGNK